MASKSVIPRPEHPRPQFERESWLNLNGSWSFDFDFGNSGLERDFQSSKGFPKSITVPFCPESKLSGVGHSDFIECLWYQRELAIPKDWSGKRTVLHFGGVDHETDVFIDGRLVGRHWGGMCSFEFDITRYVQAGSKHSLVVRAYDDSRKCGRHTNQPGTQPGGKQSSAYKSAGCHYTRTTGIWQTVWLEAAGQFGLESCQIIPDLDSSKFVFIPKFSSVKTGLKFKAVVKDGKKQAGSAEGSALDGVACEAVLKAPKAWSPESPFLYDIELSVVDASGRTLDSVKSYAGMRKVHVEGNRLLLNNKPVYLRLVLDQGFYPDGIWTAPSDADLKRDIELSMKAGFNGARLHQKLFEERFHYWADKLGYLTWGESASWGADPCEPLAARNFLPEWAEAVVRDRNHPSIIAWTPLNETIQTSDLRQHSRFHVDNYNLCKWLDPTRPVNDASGYIHVKTDLWTVHDYSQTQDGLLKNQTPKEDGSVYRNQPKFECDYTGQPFYVDEFGGIKWIPESKRPFADNSWGYGEGPKTLDEFYVRLKGQVDALLSLPHISGYCYTQLTDVEQEQNGVYNYDRTEKFDMAKIAAIFGKNGKGF